MGVHGFGHHIPVFRQKSERMMWMLDVWRFVDVGEDWRPD